MKWLKNRAGQALIFYATIPAHYILVKILLAKLKELPTSACLNLNHGTAKLNPIMQRVQKW